MNDARSESSNATGAGSHRVCADGSGLELSTKHPDELPTAVEVIVPLIIDLFQPRSVVDLAAMLEYGLTASDGEGSPTYLANLLAGASRSRLRSG